MIDYDSLTKDIYESLETAVKYNTPWIAKKGLALPLRINGEAYNGFNTMALMVSSVKKGFSSPYWLTFKMAADMDAHVRKGEKGTGVIYAKQVEKIVENDTGEQEDKSYAFYKQYTVFNADQIEGLPDKYKYQPIIVSEHERLEAAEKYISQTGAKILEGGKSAFYTPTLDYIRVPDMGSFPRKEDYYSTLFHELTHWTGAESRLDRHFAQEQGSQGYAREELVAELGATFHCARYGFELATRQDHAGYLRTWLKELKDDKKLLFRASAKAQAAVRFLDDLQSAYTPKPSIMPEQQRAKAPKTELQLA